MFSKVGQIMLYVNNQDEAVKFWTEKISLYCHICMIGSYQLKAIFRA